MQRRVLISLLAATVLPGCAGRARPLRPPVEIQRLGILRVKEWSPTGSTAPFSTAQLPATPNSSIPPPLTPSLLGMAIGQVIVAHKAANRSQLAQALTALDFSAGEAFSAVLEPLFGQLTAGTEILDSPELGAAIRDDIFTNLPTNVDAILDVQIHGAGYYPVKKIGYAPSLSVTARLVDTKFAAGEIAEFDYEVGHDDPEGDPRYFNSPLLLVSELSGFRDQAAALKQEMKSVYLRVAQQLVEDVDRFIRKLPRRE